MTKIDIFSGFLGAGKTTLIKKLIAEAYKGEKLVLIENEFGQIGIDGGFMQDAGIEVTQMNSGCICCSLVGDFDKALKKVLSEFNPDRILIEPSGVGKLSDVINAVKGVLSENVSLNSYCAVIDAKKCKMYMKNFGEFFNDQIEHASSIILSHTDAMTEDKLNECISLVREHNKEAGMVTTPWTQLDGSDILSVMENTASLENDIKEMISHQSECGSHEHHHHDDDCDCGCHNHDHHHHDDDCDCGCHNHDHHHHDDDCDCGCHDHDHHHHADDVFTSWGTETVRTYTKEKLTDILNKLSDEALYGKILRAKGIVGGNGEWIHFDYVPGEVDVRTGTAATTGKICVIGTKINEESIRDIFELN